MRFGWTPSMSVGNDELDNDHKHLAEIINEIYAPSLSDRSLRELLVTVLQKLINYTETHFRREEAFLEQRGYPYLAEHKAAHAGLEEEVKALLAKVQEDEGGGLRHAAHDGDHDLPAQLALQPHRQRRYGLRLGAGSESIDWT